MSDVIDKKILQVAQETIAWGREVAEIWVGTQYQRQIQDQLQNVNNSIEHEDWAKVRALVSDLARFLDDAEEKYGH